MATKKRAADADGAQTKQKHKSDDRAPKRLKKGDTAELQKLVDGARDEKKPIQNGVAKSLLKGEETAFPRGGASVLTPLERKQIHNDAVRDVLFEQSGNKRAKRDDIDGEDEDENEEKSTKGSKRKSKYRAPKKAAEEPEEPKIRVEGLNFKRLIPGSMVLGQVVQITSRDIALALPNNLIGYVPLTAVSDQLTGKVEKLLAAEPEEDEDEEDDSFEDIDLKKMFKIGQYLRAYVTSNGNEQPGKSKRRLELAVNPRHANFGLEKADLVKHIMVQAAIASLEDHGAIMDLGLQDQSAKAFLSFKDLGETITKDSLQEGSVLLCQVTSSKSSSDVFKLSADLRKAGDLSKSHYLTAAPTINAFLPGTAVEVMISDVSRTDVIGKVMGMVDITADHIHSGHPINGKSLADIYQVGSKAKARIIFTFPSSENQRIGVSFLPEVLSLSSATQDTSSPSQTLSDSSIVEEATVTKVDRKLGLFLDVGVPGHPAFAHISRLTEKKLDTLTEDEGTYKVGSTHRARILGYNPLDGLFLASLEESVLNQPFLRVEDIEVGSKVKGTVERIVVNDRGVGGLLVNLAEGISGLVPEMHMADVHLQHPDRKFREGMTVNARVLSTNPEKRLVRLTLKKTLVNSDITPWTSYEAISVGDQSPGTIVNLLPKGAVIQFYGDIRGFLPVHEMSESFIKNPAEHFKVGQVVNVRVLNVDAEERRLTISCKQESTSSQAQTKAFDAFKIGDITSGTVTTLTEQTIELELEAGVKAVLKLEQLTDGSEKKNSSAMKKIRASQKLQDLLVLEKNSKQKSVVLSNKPSLLKAARNNTLVKSVDDLKVGRAVDGFVRNVAGANVFVQFAGGLVGLLNKSQVSQDMLKLPEYGLRVGQSISATVQDVDAGQEKFRLTMKTIESQTPKDNEKGEDEFLVNPVDGVSKSITEFSEGKLTKARITSVKDTQLNVVLANNVQGRVDMSEVFSDMSEIIDRKKPLQAKYNNDDIIDVRVLGMRDTRSYRFLPISSRRGGNIVFELSIRAAKVKGSNTKAHVLSLEDLKTGSSHVAFVNNHEDRSVFVTLSPKVRARIDPMELSDDLSLLSKVGANFPIGSALKVKVKSVDLSSARVELTARDPTTAGPAISYEDLKKGTILPGRVTKVTDSYVMVQLNDTVSGQVPLSELVDDYDTIKPITFKKNDIVRVCVLQVDVPNRKITLSTRPSLTISSSLPTKDRHVESAAQLNVNDIVRGFVANVADVGLFVRLSPSVTAFVKVANLSDSYVKDWKAKFQLDQLVKGKVVEVDPGTKKVMLSLKPSHVENDYVAPMGWADLKKGQVVTAKVRKVEDFGVFIVVDNSNNVSGLCHKSEIADEKVVSVKKLYQEGDAVKAIVLKVEPEKRKAAFGLKASYFAQADEEIDEDEEEDMSDSDVEMGGVEIDLSDESEDDEDNNDAIVDLANVQDFDDEAEEDDDDSADEDMDTGASLAQPTAALSIGAFDWSGTVAPSTTQPQDLSDSDDQPSKKKKKSRAPQIQVDRTGDLDAHGPQSVADYERLLLGSPNDSTLWVQYMAFQIGLSEVEKAREVAERALRTINIREGEEKRNIWIAWLNLEVSFGEDEKVDEVFQRACQYNDRGDMHERLASIYVEAGKPEKALPLFAAMQKLKPLSQTPPFWLNAATFHMTTLNDPTAARQLLQRALQSVPAQHHRDLTVKFALLEFTSPNGDVERGRTVFEGLVATFPKRWDVWDCWVDAEMALLARTTAAAAPDTPAAHKKKGKNVPVASEDTNAARDLFRRMGRAAGMRPRRARYVFKRWGEFEARYGSAKDGKAVEEAARGWVEAHAAKGAEGEE